MKYPIEKIENEIRFFLGMKSKILKIENEILCNEILCNEIYILQYMKKKKLSYEKKIKL